MILVACSPGHVRLAVKDALETLHAEYTETDARDPGLPTRVRGCRAVVYAPEPRLLDAKSGAAGRAERMRGVVRSSRASGVGHLVVVESGASSCIEEEGVLEDGRVGFTIVRSPPLLDELADATNLHTAGALWLPSGREVVVATRPALATAVRHALTRDDLKGRAVAVREERLPVGEAMRRAAAIAGARVRVHVTARALSSAIRKLHAWMGIARPELDALWEELGATAEPHAHA